ncbi:MAG: RIP metalloprotease RseP [Chloroflexota bacterium]|nr:RIP metalloprotease RseP [Chloroflexota bacterium]
MTGFVSFVIVFSLLIFVHEFGHFITAKLAGVRVEEFGFGYPPRLLSLGTWQGTRITLNALPVGGFVRMNEDDPTVEGSLARKSRPVRALVLAAGSLMNLLLAIALYSLTFMLGALTPVEAPGAGIYYVAPESPAEAAGLQPGDTIVKINGEEVQGVDEAANIISQNAGESITLVVRRDGRMLSPIAATPRKNPPPNEGALGVALDLPLVRKRYPVWQAVPKGFFAIYNTIRSVFYTIRAAILGNLPIPFQVTGPIGIYQETAKVAKTGVDRLIEFTGFLSLNLFLVNLLPLPALDGGRLLFVMLERVRGGKKVPPEKEALVHAIGMAVLLAFMAVITYFDYQRYFG